MQLTNRFNVAEIKRVLRLGKGAVIRAVNATGDEVPFNPTARTLSVTTTLKAADSGGTFYLNSGTEFVTTLPAPAIGLRFTFVVAAAPATASYTVVTAASANILKGHVLTSQDAGGTADSETSGGDTLTFVDSKAVVGDKAVIESDGTSWFVAASSKVFDGITVTTAT